MLVDFTSQSTFDLTTIFVLNSHSYTAYTSNWHQQAPDSRTTIVNNSNYTTSPCYYSHIIFYRITPPANSPSVQLADPPSSSKAFIHANNELQHLSQQLMKSNQCKEQLHGTLKKVRANHSWSLATCDRLQTAISNQRCIVNHLKSQFGAGFSAPDLPSQGKSPFTTPPPASESLACKKPCLTPCSGTKTTRKLNFDSLLDATLMDAELAQAVQDT